MGFTEAIIQFVFAGASVVGATIIARRSPYLGSLVLLFPIKVLATLLFLPQDNNELLGRFLIALIPGLLAVAAFAVVAKIALGRMSPLPSLGIGIFAWTAVAAAIFFFSKV